MKRAAPWLTLLFVTLPLVAAENGPRVVPDRMLRRWDPVTVFFANAAGPAAGGAEDHAERFVTIDPAQPGAFRWLDAKTLQFRPAEPWPALSRFRVTPAGSKTTTLATLLEAPASTVPPDGAEGLEPFDEITLTFAEPLPPAELAKMISLELRPLPGVSGGRRVPPQEIRIKPLERASRADTASYALSLAHRVPAGTRAVLTLKLSADEAAAGATKELSFATGEPFRVVAFGCRERQLPVTPAGTLYEKDQALKCGAEAPAILVEFSIEPAPDLSGGGAQPRPPHPRGRRPEVRDLGPHPRRHGKVPARHALRRDAPRHEALRRQRTRARAGRKERSVRRLPAARLVREVGRRAGDGGAPRRADGPGGRTRR